MDSRLADSTDRQKIAEMIAAQREQLFKASAVIEMCRYACVSKFEAFDPEQLAIALRVVDDLIDDAAEVLEQLAGQEQTQRPDENES